MRSRRLIWILSSLLLLAGAWFFWPQAGRSMAQKKSFAKPTVMTIRSAATAPQFLTKPAVTTHAVKTGAAVTNKFAYRLSNTSKSIDELVHDDKAILLENALIDTRNALNLSIPKNLQSPGDPGAYIVQARGPIDNAFRAMLAAAGATIVSYIPNDAYLVRLSGTAANGMASQGFTVIPYEPYYKVQSPLLAFDQGSLPNGMALNLGLFGDDVPATIQQIQNLGGQIFAPDSSPFGQIVRVIPPQNWTALATLPGVQIVEPYHQRIVANDLARVTLGVATNTTTTTNYMGLTGKNVMVEMNDSGVDASHPDLTGRVIGDVPQSLVDTNGHGTHVAGIIIGDGTKSATVTNAQGSINPGVPGQYRGKAQAAKLFSVGFLGADTNIIVGGVTNEVSDSYLQETPARTNALISNNSWNFDGDNAYDLAAASYDAAVRDALPGVTGSQPVLFVFAAGNDGGGDDNGGSGIADSIASPATAKDVITVGATEQLRNITNMVTNLDGSVSAVWQPETDTSSQVAGFSSRGNVGVGIEGNAGRYKPDVVAPGTFVISTRSSQWDTNAYFDPTNISEGEFSDEVGPDSVNFYSVSVPSNAVQLTIQVVGNSQSPDPLPDMSILVWNGTDPRVAPPYVTETNIVIIPTNLASLNPVGTVWQYAVSNSVNESVNYDVVIDIVTTNDLGNYFDVLHTLDDSLGGFYRYETGTSMAAPAVSGVLALMQDYFTNTLNTLPSPALLKAMLINGARQTANYSFQVQNSINFQGWGMANLPDSLPSGLTTNLSTACSSFIRDQSPNNALATGDSQTFFVAVTNTQAQFQPLRVTLVWTDPPGNPAAAIKLVNNLDLIVSNMDTGSTVYYGNDISSGIYNTPEGTNTPPNLDSINNIENVYIPPLLSGHYAVTVVGRSVNVNAVTAQTNNVVQDFALVISSGNGQVTNAMLVTTSFASNPTGDQQITFVPPNSGALLNQTVGANSPLLGTNTLLFNGTAPENFGTNWQVTIGQTNQWHFYVVTNMTSFTNAAFVTFLPDTLSIPREGVFADSVGNATRPEADIDLYVSTNSALTNLNPTVISNAIVSGTVSLSRGGTEFVTFTNSAQNDIYYIGVKSEDQMASEYDFLPVFSQTPFSGINNGVETVSGLDLPMAIPDGSPARPGVAYIIGLATQPMEIERVVVTNQIWHQNFGDLIGPLLHNDISVVLNNHDSLGNTIGDPPFVYDDSGANDIPNSRPSDGPGSLQDFIGQQGIGPWILSEADDSLTQTGTVQQFSLQIYPEPNLELGNTNTLQTNGWFYGFVDVPSGATNLTIFATNTTPSPDLLNPLQLYVKYGSLPTQTNFDEMAVITNGIPPSGLISIGPPLTSGRYFVGVYNPSSTVQIVSIFATVGIGSVPAQVDFTSSGPVPLLDDAVTTNSLFVTQDKIISSVDVALRVDHPRVSDLVFHLISPDGTRVLLVENRGGTTTKGMGATLTASNTVAQPQVSSGNSAASTNVINTGQPSGTLTIQYNFYTLPDEMVVYDADTNIIFDSGLVSGSGVFTIPYTNSPLTIIMNPNGNAAGAGDLWDYTVDATGPTYEYLVLTENTNLTTTPIKFALPPFVPGASSATNISDFETAAPGDYTNTVSDESIWSVLNNQVSVVNDPVNAQAGNHFLALANGTISNTLPTVAGKTYALTFAYRGPGIAGWWRGEFNPTNAVDSVGGNNGVLENGLGFALGEVGDCFNFNGINQFVLINPVNSSLDVGQGSGFTMEGWIKPTTLANQMCMAEYERVLGGSGPDVGLDFYINYPSGAGSGNIYANITDTTDTPHTIVSANNLLTANFWQHVALSYNKVSGVATLYLNGAVVMQANLGTFIPQTSFNNLLLGARTAFGSASSPVDAFHGGLDEFSVYNRALSDSEIKAIYLTGSIGKFDPAVAPPQNLAKATVAISGAGSSVFYGSNTTWQTQSATFTATQNGTPMVISGLEPGMLLDSFTLSEGGGDLYYLPEQSLDTYAGDDALGQWTLEVQDDRVGATNPAPSLLSWQLRFNFTTPVTPASSIGLLTNGVPQTNTIPADSIGYYLVNVPVNADLATNSLFMTNGPLSLLFNETNPPNGMNPGDTLLFSASSNALAVLSTNSTPTNIVPGGSYYLGVLNTNGFPVNYDVEVNFHLVPPPAPITNYPISGIAFTNIGGTNGILLTWYAPTNYQYQIQWTPSLTPKIFWTTIPGAVPTLVGVAANGTGTNQYFDDFSLTGGFGVQKFYRLIAYPPGAPILVTGTLGNGVPQTNTIPADSTGYYLVNVPTNADFGTNSLSLTNGPLNLWFNETNSPNGMNPGDHLLFSASSNALTVLSTTSTPTNIVPGGSYYLGVQNTNNFAVNYDIEVNFHLIPPPPTAPITNYPISGIVFTNRGGTNGILLTWYAPTNYQYQIQWTTSLTPTIFWGTIPGAVPTLVGVAANGTGTNQYFDDFSLTGGFGLLKFYRLIAYPPGVPVPAAPTLAIINPQFTAGGIQFQWSAPVNYKYEIQWTTNLAVPLANWFILTNPVVSVAGGIFTFADTNQTGPSTSTKFFRVIEY